MTAAPIGAVVRIFYDANPGDVIRVGDVLRTRAGRVYEVIRSRAQQRGTHVGRFHLACVVMRETPAGAIVHPLCWYPRKRKGVQSK